MWSNSFNFKGIVRFICPVSYYHDNHKLYHITIMDLCDTIIMVSILLHITSVNGWGIEDN